MRRRWEFYHISSLDWWKLSFSPWIYMFIMIFILNYCKNFNNINQYAWTSGKKIKYIWRCLEISCDGMFLIFSYLSSITFTLLYWFRKTRWSHWEIFEFFPWNSGKNFIYLMEIVKFSFSIKLNIMNVVNCANSQK